jgi:tetratricopeptide (TPR) repeat protein
MKNRKHRRDRKPGHAVPAARPLYAEAVRLHQAGRLHEAGPLCERALRADPRHADSLHLLGVIATRRGEYDTAIERIGRAITIDERQAPYHNSLGNVYQDLRRFDSAIASYRRAILLRPDFAQAHANLGHVLKAQGCIEEAITSFRAALQHKPNFAATQVLLAGALEELGSLENAVAAYREAVAANPAEASGHIELGDALREQGRRDDAIACYRKALILAPDFAEAHANLGDVLCEKGLPAEAIACYEHAIAARPDYALAYHNLGNALYSLGRLDEAIDWQRKTIALDPECVSAHGNLGNALQEQGQLEAAWHEYETVVHLAPRRGISHYALATTGRVRLDSPHFAQMQALGADIGSLPVEDQIFLHFALANVYAGGGEHAKAFQHQLAGNRLKRDTISYDERGALATLKHLSTVFTKDVLESGSRHGTASQVPVFVVGMPRSGTTLIEQVLASHPDVFGAGELSYMPNLLHQERIPDGTASFAEALAALKTQGLGSLGSAYLERLRAHAPEAARIVDKAPDNYMRIGFIRLALPQARIIHVRRDPVDTCLSCFSKLFAGSLPYAYDLGELGRYYRAYEGVMAHWREVLPPGAMLEVQYEDLVADLEGQARRMLAYLDLPWDDRCLSFHKTRRTVQTASVTQVRQPLYKSSVGRWHVYGDMARPLLDALGTSDGLAL